MNKKGFLWAILVVFLTSCAAHSEGQKGKAPVSSAPPARPVLQYTDFPDLVLPNELEIIREKTLIVKTPTYVGGLIMARGRVTVESLVTFFERQLTARGWREMGSIRYKNTLLAFKRPNGSCFIYISSSSFGNLEVKIWASESLKPETSSGLETPASSYP